MTIERHFGLTSPPFPRAASGTALMMTAALQHALEKFRFALARNTFVLLSAEPGGGKSTTLSVLVDELVATNYNVLTASLTTLSSFSFVSHLAARSGLRCRRSKRETAEVLMTHLRELQKRTVILVDEAHNLPDDSLEDLRLLTAQGLDRDCPFDLIFVGQPILRERLAESQHEALWQRTGVRIRLRPLNENEITLFLEHHMNVAGSNRKGIFEPAAIAEIFRHSRGIPRLVQNIALEAMLAAMDAGKSEIDAKLVQRAVVDMEAN